MLAIKASNVSKVFKVSKLIPSSSTFGQVHWLISLRYILGFREKRKIIALNNINLEIDEEIFGIVGPNASGKTTLLKIFSGLLLPDSGKVEVYGHDIVEEEKIVKRLVNFVGSARWITFDYHLTVRENLEFFSLIYGLEKSYVKSRINEVLGMLGLLDRQDDYVWRLSAGMRQKMSIARGLILETPILLLDEPTTGLDPLSARDLRDYIRIAVKEKKLYRTVVISSHNMRDIEDLCDKVAIIHKGRIIKCGTLDEIIRSVRGLSVIEVEGYNIPYNVCELIGRIYDVVSVNVEFKDESIGRGNIRVLTDSPERIVYKVVKALIDINCRILSLKMDKPTLNDAYMKIIGVNLYGGKTRS